MLAGIIALFMIVAARGAHADSITNGGGCVPNDATIKNQLHWVVTGGMRVKFQPATTGTIRLVCPVTGVGLLSRHAVIEVFYQDPDGNGTNYQVKAHLRAVRLSDGAYSTLCTVGSTDDAEPWNYMWCSTISEEPLDPSQFAYWVEVEIFRNLITKTVEFNAVRLLQCTSNDCRRFLNDCLDGMYPNWQRYPPGTRLGSRVCTFMDGGWEELAQ
jgi:hypothetical protein